MLINKKNKSFAPFNSKELSMAEEEEQEQEQPPLKRRKGKEPLIVELEVADAYAYDFEAPQSSSQPPPPLPSKPKTTMSFEFGKAVILRQCLECLCDSKLNPELMGMVETPKITDHHHHVNGFQITVRNEATQVVACLFLAQNKLNNFRCFKPLLPHFIYLKPIFDLLVKTTDNGRVKISHTQAPPHQQSHLSFKSYSTTIGISVNQLIAPLIKLKDDPKRFPYDINSFCFAVIPSNYMREMLQFLEEPQEAPLVLMVVKLGLVDIFVGQQDDWKLTWRQIRCRTESNPEDMQYDAYFVLPHAKAMRKALSLDPEPVIHFLRVPENHILMHFRVDERGDLPFLSKAIRVDRKIILPAARDPQLRSDAAEAAQLCGDAVRASKEQEQPEMIRRNAAEREVTMSFEISKAAILRNSLDSLCDSDLNPGFLGVVKASTYYGFKISVQNKYSEVAASLYLFPHKLTNFQCTKPLLPHMIDLDEILDFLQNTIDHETIFISRTETLHDRGSQLSFKSCIQMADDPAHQLNVPLTPLENDPVWFPDNIKIMAYAPISFVILEELIETLDDDEEDLLVLIVLNYGLVEVFVGQEDDWKSRWHFECDTKGQRPGMQYFAYFNWVHTESLRKALVLDSEPVIYFLSEPEKHIMIRFDLDGHGYVKFLTKATRLHQKAKIPVKKDFAGGDAVEVSHPGIDADKDPQTWSDAAMTLLKLYSDAFEASKEQEQPAWMRRNRTKSEVMDLAKSTPPFIPRVTMSFEVGESGILRQSLESLCDANLNPKFLGTVKVATDRGFQITVQNKDTGVVAKLFFLPHMLRNFHCTQSLDLHMIELVPILDYLTDTPDDDIIFISHKETPPDEASQLSFKSYIQLAEDPDYQMEFPLTPLKISSHERFPDEIKFFCSTPIPSFFLEDLIQTLKEAEEIQKVLIVVKYGLVEMFVGQPDDWKSKWKFECSDTTEQTPGIQYAAYFDLPHTESIRKALSLDPETVLYFLSDPENHIMMEFNTEGCGNMVFLIKAIRLDIKIKIPVEDFAGGDAVEDSQRGINAAEEPQPSSDAAEALQPGSSTAAIADATLQPGNDAAGHSRPSGDAAEASQPSGVADEASQNHS